MVVSAWHKRLPDTGQVMVRDQTHARHATPFLAIWVNTDEINSHSGFDGPELASAAYYATFVHTSIAQGRLRGPDRAPGVHRETICPLAGSVLPASTSLTCRKSSTSHEVRNKPRSRLSWSSLATS